jgi:predicted nucleic acid-binding protein
MSRSAATPPLLPEHSGYLLDTSVISALAPGREFHSPGFADWLHAHAEHLFIPCIAIAELEQGICKLHRAGGVERARRLRRRAILT